MKPSYSVQDQFVCSCLVEDGPFAGCWEAMDRETGDFHYLKVVDRNFVNSSPKRLADFSSEVSLLSALHHHKIPSLIDFMHDEESFYIILEKPKQMSLFDRIKTKGRFSMQSDDMVLRFLLSLSEIVNYLENELEMKNWNLSFETIYVDDDGKIVQLYPFPRDSFIVNSSEFAISRTISPEEIMFNISNSKKSKNNQNNDSSKVNYTINQKSVSWFIGVTVYLVTVGCFPFNGKSVESIENAVLRTHPAYPEYISKPLKDIIFKLLIKNPQMRMSFTKIDQDPFVLGSARISPANSPQLSPASFRQKGAQNNFMNSDEDEDESMISDALMNTTAIPTMTTSSSISHSMTRTISLTASSSVSSRSIMMNSTKKSKRTKKKKSDVKFLSNEFSKLVPKTNTSSNISSINSSNNNNLVEDSLSSASSIGDGYEDNSSLSSSSNNANISMMPQKVMPKSGSFKDFRKVLLLQNYNNSTKAAKNSNHISNTPNDFGDNDNEVEIDFDLEDENGNELVNGSAKRSKSAVEAEKLSRNQMQNLQQIRSLKMKKSESQRKLSSISSLTSLSNLSACINGLGNNIMNTNYINNSKMLNNLGHANGLKVMNNSKSMNFANAVPANGGGGGGYGNVGCANGNNGFGNGGFGMKKSPSIDKSAAMISGGYPMAVCRIPSCEKISITPRKFISPLQAHGVRPVFNRTKPESL